MNKKKNFLVVFSFLVVLVGAMVFSGCETSRVAPELPRPNPPAPAPQSVILSGYVLDGGTGGGIPNATVSLTKLDGTVVSTSVTNASGLYSFNLTALNVTDATLNVRTNVTGYGYAFRIATYDKAIGSAGVTPIILTKIASVTTVTIGTAGGAATTPPTSDSKATTPVGVTVPPNAVPANTQVTVAAVPVVSTPPPSVSTAAQNITSSNNLVAPGVTTFGVPVTMTFNLPFPEPAGTTIPLLLLNTTTNRWENAGINATVNATELVATAQVTKPGQYALLGEVGLSEQGGSGKILIQNEVFETPLLKKELGVNDALIELTPTFLSATHTGPSDPPPFVTVISGNPAHIPSNSFLYGLLQSVFGVNFLNSGLRYQETFTYNLPATLNGALTTRNGIIIGPPGKENESGDYIFRISIKETLVNKVYRISKITGRAWVLTVTDPSYVVTKTAEWIWRTHNQGGGN